MVITLSAQSGPAENITSIATTFIKGTPTTTGGITYNNNILRLDSFTTGAASYNISQLANQVFIRRNTASSNLNQSSYWYAVTPSGAMQGSYVSNYSTMLLTNNLFQGSDDTFSKGTTIDSGNIARLDFKFGSTLTASNNVGFAVFDRGDVNLHDGFGIAAITGWDNKKNLPTSYGPLITQQGGWGSTNVLGSFTYDLFRYDNGNNTSSPTSTSQTETQGMGGLLFTMSELGVAVGTPVYGYSLFGYDVTSGGNSANLIPWNNPTYFPTTTGSQTGAGGLDLTTMNGVAFSVVPEPSTYVTIGSLILGMYSMVHRYKKRKQLCNV